MESEKMQQFMERRTKYLEKLRKHQKECTKSVEKMKERHHSRWRSV